MIFYSTLDLINAKINPHDIQLDDMNPVAWFFDRYGDPMGYWLDMFNKALYCYVSTKATKVPTFQEVSAKYHARQTAIDIATEPFYRSEMVIDWDLVEENVNVTHPQLNSLESFIREHSHGTE
jgi:hypothetical protein